MESDDLIDELEKRLLSLLRGEHSHLTISFNEDNGINYTTVKDAVENRSVDYCDWVSEGEREEAMKTNSEWNIQWYPDTPVGSYSLSASSLQALLSGLPYTTP